MRRYLLLGAVAALLAIPALAFGRATTTVTVNGNYFKPVRVKQRVGAGDIHWQWGTRGRTFGEHNVRQDDKLFFSGTPTDDNPAGFDVEPSAGKFHYFCDFHGNRSGGMDGTLKIKPAIFNQRAHSFKVRWSTGSNDSGNAFSLRYRVDGGKWKKWKKHVTKTSGKFGGNGKPVRVRKGHTYDIQARSEKKSNTKKRSNWSPKARVKT
jgi:plastocyanin